MPRSELGLKIIVAGDGGVGKTTLIRKFVTGSFDAETNMTIGVDFHVKQLIYEGQPVTLQIWDLGGQDRFRFILPSYTRGARGAILLYDTTHLSSLNSLKEWVNICRTYSNDLPILLCGTKIDRVLDRSVSREYAEEFLQPLALCGHLEISAKTGENVEKAFAWIITKIIFPHPLPLLVPISSRT